MSHHSIEDYHPLPQQNCNSCAYNYEGYYCPKCGQKHHSERFTLKQSSLWIFDKLFNLEKGIFYTLKELLFRPGKTIIGYFNRDTVRYMHPFRFVFVLATISAILTVMLSSYDSSELSEQMNAISGEQSEKSKEFYDRFFGIFNDYLTLIIMLGIPFNALASKIVYLKYKYNFAEHLILNSFGYGLTIAISLPAFFLIFIPNGLVWGTFVNLIIYYFGFAWIFSKVFKESILISILKAILQSIVTLILIAIATVILVIIIVIIKKYLF